MRNLTLFAAAAAAALATTASAAPRIAMSAAVAAAEAATQAKAFDAELDHRGARAVYDIELMKDGRVITVDVDAQTSAVDIRERGRIRVLADSARRAAQTAPRTLTQTIQMIENATKGRVSDIGLERRNGRAYYEVELVGAQDRDVLVDVQTGAIAPLLDD